MKQLWTKILPLVAVFLGTLLVGSALAEDVQTGSETMGTDVQEVGLLVGERAPDFTLPDIYRGSLTLYEEMAGYKATIIHFFYVNGG